MDQTQIITLTFRSHAHELESQRTLQEKTSLCTREFMASNRGDGVYLETWDRRSGRLLEKSRSNLGKENRTGTEEISPEEISQEELSEFGFESEEDFDEMIEETWKISKSLLERKIRSLTGSLLIPTIFVKRFGTHG